MKFVKIFLIVIGGLSLAWAAQEATEDPSETPVVEELSQAELDAEMERMERALDESEELKEFIPSKPLAADLPVALPSDI